jgi:hypothetical protein
MTVKGCDYEGKNSNGKKVVISFSEIQQNDDVHWIVSIEIDPEGKKDFKSEHVYRFYKESDARIMLDGLLDITNAKEI